MYLTRRTITLILNVIQLDISQDLLENWENYQWIIVYLSRIDEFTNLLIFIRFSDLEIGQGSAVCTQLGVGAKLVVTFSKKPCVLALF